MIEGILALGGEKDSLKKTKDSFFMKKKRRSERVFRDKRTAQKEGKKAKEKKVGGDVRGRCAWPYPSEGKVASTWECKRNVVGKQGKKIFEGQGPARGVKGPRIIKIYPRKGESGPPRGKLVEKTKEQMEPLGGPRLRRPR